MNLFTKQKQTHRHQKQTYGYQRGQRGWGGEISQEFGINRYTLLYVKQITNKDLLYSTGNYIQYLVITYNGKEYEKEKLKLSSLKNQLSKNILETANKEKEKNIKNPQEGRRDRNQLREQII